MTAEQSFTSQAGGENRNGDRLCGGFAEYSINDLELRPQLSVASQQMLTPFRTPKGSIVNGASLQ